MTDRPLLAKIRVGDRLRSNGLLIGSPYPGTVVDVRERDAILGYWGEDAFHVLKADAAGHVIGFTRTPLENA